MSKEDFDSLFAPKLKPEQKKILMALTSLEAKASEIASELGEVFTFSNFEGLYLANRAASDSLEAAFNDYIELIGDDRPSTKSSYECARNAFKSYRPKARIGDVSVRFLQDFERWMLEKGNSITSVGIYCRTLRSVLNWLIDERRLSRELYPFGSSKSRKYEIPTGKNIKKALSLDDIRKIFEYQCEPGSVDEMCRDYWVFLYLGNGINVKDFCLLKWENISGNRLSFIREKTKRTKKDVEAVTVVLQPEMFDIMIKWGSKNKHHASYIFPHLEMGMSATDVRKRVQLVTRLINNHMKKIASYCGITAPVKTYEARHSFATILSRSGAPTAMISQALGHSSIATTQAYLASFETDQLSNATVALTSFKRKAANE